MIKFGGRGLALTVLALLGFALAGCDLNPPQPQPTATPTAIRVVEPSPTVVAQGSPTTSAVGSPVPTGLVMPELEIASPTALQPITPALPLGPLPTMVIITPPPAPGSSAGSCEPTSPDGEGPFYVPGAPERTKVGEGHVLSGAVKSSKDCTAIPFAKIEFWLTGPDGQYDDAHRATVTANDLGLYRFESNYPGSYPERPVPHIHIKVTAPGYRQLTTQFYPAAGTSEGTFDLVLIPEG